MINKENVEAVYPLSPMQQGMLFHSLRAPGSGYYVVQGRCVLTGELHLANFKRAWQKIIDRHAVLRTAFALGKKMAQVAIRTVPVPLVIEDWTEVPEQEREQRLELYQKQERERDFDFSEAPLIRLCLIRTGDRSHYFVWSCHHVLLDGWSNALLIQELAAYYGAYCRGEQLELPRPRPYVDYILWLQRQSTTLTEAFWRRTLEGFQSPTPLPFGAVRQAGAESYRRSEQVTELSSSTAAALQAVGRQKQVTLNTIVQGALAVVLARHGGCNDVVFGATVSGRPATLTGVGTMVGMFINTLPLRVQIEPGESLLTLLRRVQHQQSEAQKYAYTPLVDIQGWSEVPRGTPLFECSLTFLNYPKSFADLGSQPAQNGGESASHSFRVENLRVENRASYPLSLVVDPVGGFKLTYDPDLFTFAEIGLLLDHLRLVLEAVATDVEQPVGQVQMLTRPELERLLVEWNRTSHDYDEWPCVHELFERQAERAPDALAVTFKDRQLSYAGLNEAANRLAHYLAEVGVGPEVRVALCMERGLEIVVGLLAVLKAGGAYVPMDPSYPAERLAYMLEDAQAPVLLTQSHVSAKLPSAWVQCVDLDREWDALGRYPATNPNVEVNGANLAYMIYTSGSTGKPKGVLVSNQCLRDSTLARLSYYGDRVESYLLLSSFAFDSSVAGIFWSLIDGGMLAIPTEDDQRDPSELVKIIYDSKVSHLLALPSLYELILKAGAGQALRSLTTVIVAGESCFPGLLASHGDLLPHCRLVNEYGPTEVTVWSTAWRLGEEISGERVPIGKPIPNTSVYVLDESMEPLPAGVTGELYIGGERLARGYLNQAELTPERFVPDGLSGRAGGRLYRTGDKVRWQADGNLEFLGRLDEQVKIRGYRIELKEIESVLSQHLAVEQCAVVVKEDELANKRLVAYVVASAERVVSAAEMREYLGTGLPDYMIPATFIELKQMPLTANGKLDRKALLDVQDIQEAADDEKLRTPIEEILCGIWADVLRVGSVGTRQNFFELGGHSLLATQVVSRIRDLLDVELAVRVLFESMTVAELAEVVERERRADQRLEAPPIKPVTRDRALPLSFSQQRLWFIHQLEPDSTAYNVPISVRLRGKLDIPALKQSINDIVVRHEVLRTKFSARNGQPIQVIEEPTEVELPLWDLSELEESQRELRARGIVGQEFKRPFDLERGPVWRAGLIKITQQDHVLMMTIHHIASDGWSMGVLVKEFTALYEQYSSGRKAELPELEVQYADYAVWQREWLQGEVLQEQIDYWRNQLEGAPALELPTDRPRPAVATHRGAEVSFRLSAELTERLKELSRREGVTMFMTLLAAFQVLLGKYAGQDDISTGTLIANRTRVETEGLIGFFINQLVLRADLSGAPSLRELLRRVRETTLAAYAHQDIPFEKIVEELSPERDLARAPLCQVLFLFHNAPPADWKPAELTLIPFGQQLGVVRYDLELTMTEIEEGIGANINYNVELFEPQTAARMTEHLKRLLEEMAREPDRSIDQLSLLTPAEEWQLNEEWNDTKAEYPEQQCIHELFEQQVERSPEAVAVSCQGQWLTYEGLNRRANLLASSLVNSRVGAEKTIAILANRGINFLISIMAVFKAGAAYLPLDPQYPLDRLRRVLSISESEVVLTGGELNSRIAPLLEEAAAGDGPAILRIEEELREVGEAESVRAGCDPRNVAYVIFTSGSTGTPKGAMIEHKGMLNHLYAKIKGLALNEADTIAETASPCFDISVWQFLAALLAGGRVHIIDDEAAHVPSKLIREVNENGVTVLEVVPSMLRAMLEEAASMPATDLTLAGLRLLVVTGEALPPDLCRSWLGQYPCIPILNAYGPTECSDDVTHHLVEITPAEGEARIPIGRSLSNTRTYVIDKNGRQAPIGIEGELYVGGDGVGRGYFKDGAQTANSFVPDPYGKQAGARLYRTGDRTRHRADGAIEFLGRIDHQVKVRGYRIELGEIEAALLSHTEVHEALAVAREDGKGGQALVGYLVLREGAELDVRQLHGFLKERLPEYMVPSAFVSLDNFPLTPNGKLDRKALPAPSIEQAATDIDEARSPVEEILCSIWADVLRAESVATRQNFFELGGHSLLATQVISRVREAFNVEVPLRALFESPTVAGIAEVIEREKSAGRIVEAPPIVAVSRDRELPLSFAQQRLWFIHQLEPDSPAYNLPFALRLKGDLDVSALSRSLADIVARHEVLRTRFEMRRGVPVQVIDRPAQVELPVWDVSALQESDRRREARRVVSQGVERPFDLGRGPMWRAGVVRLTADEHILVVNIHHVISDDWSMGVLVKEFTALYEGYRGGRRAELPPLAIQYADYAVWQREWLQGEVLDTRLEYWKKQLDGVAVLEMPTDRPRPAVAGYKGAREDFHLSAELGEKLRQTSRREGVSLFMSLLAGFQVLLARYSGQPDIAVGTAIAGRNRREIEGLIGLFVNTLVMRVGLGGNLTVRELLSRVRETTLGAYMHQDVPFDKIVEELRPGRSLSHQPLFQVMFTLQNVPREARSMKGMELKSEPLKTETAKFELELLMVESGGKLFGTLEYATELFEGWRIRRLLGHFEQVLEAMVADVNSGIRDLQLMSDAERQEVVVDWNQTAAEFPRDLSLHQLIEQQVDLAPDRVAAVCQQEHLTYQYLNRVANQVAGYLRATGVAAESVVAVGASRGLGFLVSMLGVFKAGAAYLPLDLRLPASRLEHLLAESKARVVLTTRESAALLESAIGPAKL